MTTTTLTHEKIREAAATSPEAKKALQVLAPEAFEAPLETFDTLINDSRYGRRIFGEYRHKGLCLSPYYVWAIVTDSTGETILTARRKETR